MLKPCNSRNFYYFLLGLHLNHRSLDKDHCNSPVRKGGKKVEDYCRMRRTHNFQRQYNYLIVIIKRITVDSLLIRLLGFPSASIISRAYNSLWALLILRSSFQLSPSLLFKLTKEKRKFPESTYGGKLKLHTNYVSHVIDMFETPIIH